MRRFCSWGDGDGRLVARAWRWPKVEGCCSHRWFVVAHPNGSRHENYEQMWPLWVIGTEGEGGRVRGEGGGG